MSQRIRHFRELINLPPIWHIELLTSDPDSHYSGPHLEIPRFSQVFDAFKRFVLLSIHFKTAHLKACTEKREV